MNLKVTVLSILIRYLEGQIQRFLNIEATIKHLRNILIKTQMQHPA